MSESLAISHAPINGFEDLRDAIHGSYVEVMQLGRGRFRGSLTHIGIEDFSLSIGSFSTGVRTQRTSSDDKLVIGILMQADDRVNHWSYDMEIGDVLLIPASSEHDGTFHGGATYGAARLDPEEVAAIFQNDGRLGDLETWHQKIRYKADPAIGAIAIHKLHTIVTRLSDIQPHLSAMTADFWRRSILDALTAAIVQATPPDDPRLLVSTTKLVRDVEAYVGAAGHRPVHISEISAAFRVSRRTLHRIFHEVFGIGPVTFLRHKRLCQVHSALRNSDPEHTTIASIAIHHGFAELGRFSQYYRSLFGEYPSETLRNRQLRDRSATLAPQSIDPIRWRA
jgi:AraC family ethanolamine operon transcriptional activator